MKLAAQIEAGSVVRVIVVPPDTEDVAAFCASLGLDVEWVEAESNVGIGWGYEGSEFIAPPAPEAD